VIDFIEPAVLPEIVATLDRLGFQCHFHAIGDAAVRNALDAVQHARHENGAGGRHHIAHVQVVNPADIVRFAELDVAANSQVLWACNEPAMTELTVPVLGEERARWQYPFASLAAAGARLAMGSDWPVTTADVLDQISVATRRLPIGDPAAEVFGPGEVLDLPSALAAATAGSAFVNGTEARKGAVETGKDADLAVLSDDLFGVDDPAEVSVAMTVVSGRVIFEA
jgi:predicted amidohydrolase YtcJ